MRIFCLFLYSAICFGALMDSEEESPIAGYDTNLEISFFEKSSMLEHLKTGDIHLFYYKHDTQVHNNRARIEKKIAEILKFPISTKCIIMGETISAVEPPLPFSTALMLFSSFCNDDFEKDSLKTFLEKNYANIFISQLQ